MYKMLEYALDAGVATVTLNRPERQNRLSPELINELLYALKNAADDELVRVVVLAARGKNFCAGGDLGQMVGGGVAESELPPMGDFTDLLLAMVRMPKPLVARVHGPAMGGGVGLVAACHFAVASSDVMLGLPELNLGIFPMMIMAVLARTMPRRALLEMMLLTQKITADEAVRVGLLNRTAPPAELDVAVAELAGRLAEKAPGAMRKGLLAYAHMGDKSLDDALPWLREQLYELLGADEAREGLVAFMEKRAPRWAPR